jgi:hypothetical protein
MKHLGARGMQLAQSLRELFEAAAALPGIR